MRFFYIAIFIIASLSSSFAQEKDFLTEKYQDYLSKFEQQKIFVHTDKSSYFAGDVIWAKVYVVSATTHKLDSLESTVYLDFIHWSGAAVSKRILKVEDGVASVDFNLSDSISDGNYILRAYTQHMLNFDEDFIFEMPVYVHNPDQGEIMTRREVKENKSFNKSLEKLRESYDFEIFTEGGTAVAGTSNLFAFRAKNELGKGIPVEGWVISNKTDSVLSFSSRQEGMGTFSFRPRPGRDYQVHYKMADDKYRKTDLSFIKQQGVSLRVIENENNFEISVRRRYPDGFPSSLRNIHLVVHTHGQIIKHFKLNENQHPYLTQIDKEEMRRGVSVATVFDSDYNVVAERLFFFYEPSDELAQFAAYKTPNDSLEVTFSLPDQFAEAGSWSLSVLGARNRDLFDPTTNIAYHLFLDSEFRSALPPGFYDPEKEKKYLDMLMLTHEWERFDWQDVFVEEYPDKKFPREKGYRVYGELGESAETRETGRLSFDVSLQIEDQTPVLNTKTRDEGKFHFSGIEQEGTFEAELSLHALEQSSKASSIHMFPPLIDHRSYNLDHRFKNLNILNRQRIFGGDYHSWKAPSGIANIKDDLEYHYGDADQIIYMKQNDERFRSMRDVLVSKAPGVSVSGTVILIRGVSSINMSNAPFLLVDGQEYSSAQFLALSPFDVSHIEIYKGSSSSIFGVRGTNGVIVAHTRRTTLPQSVVFEYVMDGYYQPRNFQPTLLSDLLNENPNQYVQTLYWSPEVFSDEKSQGKSLRFPLYEDLNYIKFKLQGVNADGEVVHNEEVFDL
ncbi:MAG: TonB-dependent receptor [Bacteroidales bacterium]